MALNKTAIRSHGAALWGHLHRHLYSLDFRPEPRRSFE